MTLPQSFGRALILFVAFATPLTAQARLSALPRNPDPGSIIRLSVTGRAGQTVDAVTGTMEGEPLHFSRSSSRVWHSIGPVSVDALRSVGATAIVRYASGGVDTVRTAIRIVVPPRPKAVPLAVDTGFTQKLDAATEARIARENALAREVGRHAHDTPRLWTRAFVRPRESVVTSRFGSGRLFNGQLTSRHLGVDFRGAVGEPIRAANRGVVALVDSFFLAGKVVYVDHGGGLVTAYFHMSKPLVQVGDTVNRGDEIGLVGQTGRVTGPHLHWAARYGTLTVNPMDLVALSPEWFVEPKTTLKRH